MDSRIIYGPPKEIVLPTQSLGKTFYERLQKVNKNFIALINADNTNEFLTYGDVLEFSKNLSINLRHFGIKTNDVIGIVAANCIHYYLPILAGFYLGALVHLISSNSTEHELRHLLKISKPKIVFCSKSSLENVKLVKNEFNIEKLVIFDDTHDHSKDIIRIHDLIKEINGNDSNFEFEISDIDPKENVAFLLNSSGTTGLPKAAMVTHESIWTMMDSKYLNLLSYGIQGTGICTGPLSHAFGFSIAFVSLLSFSKLIIMNKFKTELFFELIQNFRIRKLFLVPTLVNLLVTSPKTKEYDLSSIEEIASGAAPLQCDLAEKVVKKFNLKKLYQLYACSEYGLIASSQPKEFKSSFCEGQLFSGKILKISDLNTNEPLGVGKVGEICVKGGIFKGYMNNEEKTRESIDDEGFFRTGDAGYYDEKGQLYITDRIKDIIKYKSFQFSPVEVEEVLLRHPTVEDVAIVGKPDKHAGELPVAFIVKKAGSSVDENEIINYVEKFFSVQKQLHGGVKFVEKIPKTITGKILRYKLKELL